MNRRRTGRAFTPFHVSMSPLFSPRSRPRSPHSANGRARGVDAGPGVHADRKAGQPSHTGGPRRVTKWMLCAGRRLRTELGCATNGRLAINEGDAEVEFVIDGTRRRRVCSRPAAPPPAPHLDGRAFATRRARPPFVCAREEHGPRVGIDPMEICRMLRRDWREDQRRRVDARMISHTASLRGLVGLGPYLRSMSSRPTCARRHVNLPIRK